MIVQACLNGSRARGWHPALPITAEEIARDARAVVAAGAAELHLHVRDLDGAESPSPDAVDAALTAVRRAVPGTLVGISTGAWIALDDEQRLKFIAGWRELPDHASVNLSEAGAPDLIALLRERGVAVEAGLASVADAERLVGAGLGRHAMRVLVEMEEQDTAAAIATADSILAILARARTAKPILLHGLDASVWPLVRHAFARGFSTRIGLEDGAILCDGTPAASNAALVTAAMRLREAAPSSGSLP